jgi:predicted Zn finger-like uncharacterized protein
MNVRCPQCSIVYRVDPAKVPSGGVRARCSACGGVIPVGMASERPVSAPAFAGMATPAPPQRATPPTHTAPIATPPPAAPVRQSPPTPPRSATLPPPRPTPRTPWPSVATPSSPLATQGPPARPFVPSQTPISVPAVTPPPAPAIPIPAAPPAPGERRPINPFLTRDPSLRAKRLARALVSDMVAYYPAKHSEGLQRGTLKELFREEIKKSYDEYVAQVGAEFARTTTHFQEALNEVLGAGKRIF